MTVAQVKSARRRMKQRTKNKQYAQARLKGAFAAKKGKVK